MSLKLKSEWIDCKEALPLIFTEVLVYTIHGNVRVGNLTAGANNWHLLSSDLFSLTFITHWMPLPKSPSKLIIDIDELYDACKTVVDGYEGDGMENMDIRDEVFYKYCKMAISKI